MNYLKNTNVQQMLEIAKNIPFFDPFLDLGEFDGDSLSFKNDVESLINEFTGDPYSQNNQMDIYQMRELFIAWHKEMLEDENQKIGIKKYNRDPEHIKWKNQLIEAALRAGFSFKEISSFTGYSESTLRNSWSKNKYSRFGQRVVYLKKDLRRGKVKNVESVQTLKFEMRDFYEKEISK